MRSPASLTTARDFRQVLAGAKARSDGVTVFVAHRDDDEAPRLGLAVGRRVGSAVTRNRIKRRLRAAFRSAVEAPGSDILVTAGPGTEGLSYQELGKHLVAAVTRAKESG